MKRIYKKIKKFIPFVLILVAVFFYFNSKTNLTSIVKKINIENRVVKKTISASGYIKAKEQADISFVSTGAIKNIYVKEGQSVWAGQILASIDSDSQRQTMQYYKDARDIAKRELELFIHNKKDNEDTLGGPTAYGIKLKEYEESLSQAEANYQAQVSNVSKTNIISPINGTVIDIDKEIGETAALGETVVTVGNLNSFIFEVLVDQEDYGSIKVGQEVEIKLDSYGDKVFTGKVNKLPSHANASDGSFTVEIDINKTSEDNLAIGMTGDAYMIVTSSVREVPSLLYSDILLDDDDKPYVWVSDNGKAVKQSVEVGIEGDLYTEIKTSIDKPVIIPAKDGMEIKEGYFTKVIN
ncbi:MAG: efflux RND transporter periplasmic adaptor subunit [Patescibacteria group bacterium]